MTRLRSRQEVEWSLSSSPRHAGPQDEAPLDLGARGVPAVLYQRVRVAGDRVVGLPSPPGPYGTLAQDRRDKSRLGSASRLLVGTYAVAATGGFVLGFGLLLESRLLAYWGTGLAVLCLAAGWVLAVRYSSKEGA